VSVGAIDFEWADGTYRFNLPIAQLDELQTRCDAGPMVILQRLQHGVWRWQDVYETLRLGLIGAGMEAVSAMKLCKLYTENRWLENVPAAYSVMYWTLYGRKDPVGKSPADGEESDPPARMESSTTETSMASEP